MAERGAGTLPPLAGEDHVCASCDLRYVALGISEARALIAGVPERVRAVVDAIPEPARRERPAPDRWSAVEYVCHLRDVYVTYTVRLHRVRTEDRPVLEPMLNDLRARRFAYNDSDLDAVLGELAASVAGFLEECVQVRDSEWDRVATRLPGEERTARWLVRQAAHEGVHHAKDLDASPRSLPTFTERLHLRSWLLNACNPLRVVRRSRWRP